MSRKEKQRLLVDLDGTAAKFTPVDTLEILYEKGYFRNLEPQMNVINAVKEIIRDHPEKEVYILSSVLSDSPYAEQEKNEWIDEYLPEIDSGHRIFPPCGKDKKDFVPGGIRQDDVLLDDYTNNLINWQPPAKGIKVLNGINHTHGTWKYDRVSIQKEPSEIAANIISIMEGKERILDLPPVENSKKTFSIEEANKEYNAQYRSGYTQNVSNLQFINRQEAKQALKEGIHICYINAFPEYHGIHADEYRVQELLNENDIDRVYDRFGNGLVNQACVSPFYNENIKKVADYIRDRNFNGMTHDTPLSYVKSACDRESKKYGISHNGQTIDNFEL